MVDGSPRQKYHDCPHHHFAPSNRGESSEKSIKIFQLRGTQTKSLNIKHSDVSTVMCNQSNGIIPFMSKMDVTDLPIYCTVNTTMLASYDGKISERD